MPLTLEAPCERVGRPSAKKGAHARPPNPHDEREFRPPGGIARRAFWMSTSRGSRAAWLHLPNDAEGTSAHGVVVCPPIGHEYHHGYRSLRELSDRLSRAGVPVLRFDYHGLGSSTGSLLDDDLVEAWLDDVRTAAQTMQRHTGAAPTLLGVHLGATLAAVATTRMDVHHLVAWAAIERGRRYVREQRAMAEISNLDAGDDEGDPGPAGTLEAGGSVLTAATAAHIASLDLSELDYRIGGRALILEPDELPPARRLAARLNALGVAVDVRGVGGYVDMMTKPHLTVVPRAAIRTIVEWITDGEADRDDSFDGHPERAALDARPLRTEHTRSRSIVHVEAREEFVQLPGEPALFGVFTAPLWHDPRHPVLLLVSGGSVHNVGPHGLYVSLSRSLARAGFASLRVDLRNLGDSAGLGSPEENHPYPRTAHEDVRRTVEWLTSGRAPGGVVVAGLCSGAHHAFRAAVELEDEALLGALLLNPLTFRWREGDSLATPSDANYQGPVRSPKRWRKLWSGAYGPRDVLRFVARSVLARVGVTVARMLRRVGLLPPSRLATDLAHVAAVGRRVDFVFSEYDPGRALLMNEAGRTFERMRRRGEASIDVVAGADHTFSRSAWRAAVTRIVVDRMEGYLGVTSAPAPSEPPRRR